MNAQVSVTTWAGETPFSLVIEFISFAGLHIYFDEWFNGFRFPSQAKVLHMMSGKASTIVRVWLLTCQHQKTACTTEHRRPAGAKNPRATGVDAK
jgi:hypothetical protein